MFAGDQDIGCVFLPMRHMLNSLPLFSYSCAKTPALSVMLANTHEPATRHFKPPTPRVPLSTAQHC